MPDIKKRNVMQGHTLHDVSLPHFLPFFCMQRFQLLGGDWVSLGAFFEVVAHLLCFQTTGSATGILFILPLTAILGVVFHSRKVPNFLPLTRCFLFHAKLLKFALGILVGFRILYQLLYLCSLVDLYYKSRQVVYYDRQAQKEKRKCRQRRHSTAQSTKKPW